MNALHDFLQSELISIGGCFESPDDCTFDIGDLRIIVNIYDCQLTLGIYQSEKKDIIFKADSIDYVKDFIELIKIKN